MPSRMLVALTAATASAEMPGAASTSCTHSQISAQLPVVSNSCEPGASGRVACDHSRWPIASWWPSGSNTTARQLPVPASMASNSWSVMPGALRG